MKNNNSSAGARRGVLIALLLLAVLVLVLALAAALPILLHKSVGGSGQEIPSGYVTETSATGADGRTRELAVTGVDGASTDLAALVPGEELLVRGTGYDSNIGIYVSICKVPEQAGEKPSPCLGGLPEGATTGDAAGVIGSSAWITDAWAWRAFATQGYDDAATGAFEVRIIVPEAVQKDLDCTQQVCAITTRADHTALSDRVQDMLLPVAFSG